MPRDNHLDCFPLCMLSRVPRCVDVLLEKGVKYKAKDEDGNTGLDWAMRQDFGDISELVIDFDLYMREQRKEGRRGRSR